MTGEKDEPVGEQNAAEVPTNKDSHSSGLTLSNVRLLECLRNS
jgi:hypothetical protein